MTPGPKESDDVGLDGITSFSRSWTLMCNGFKFATGQFNFPLGGLGGFFRVVHGPVYVAALHHSTISTDFNWSVAKYILDVTPRGLATIVEKKKFEDRIFEEGQVGFISPGWLPLCVGMSSKRSVLVWQPCLSKWYFKKMLGLCRWRFHWFYEIIHSAIGCLSWPVVSCCWCSWLAWRFSHLILRRRLWVDVRHSWGQGWTGMFTFLHIQNCGASGIQPLRCVFEVSHFDCVCWHSSCQIRVSPLYKIVVLTVVATPLQEVNVTLV